MTNLQLKIIKRAVSLRVNAGEDLDSILSSYSKLSQEEVEEIKKEYV